MAFDDLGAGLNAVLGGLELRRLALYVPKGGREPNLTKELNILDKRQRMILFSVIVDGHSFETAKCRVKERLAKHEEEGEF